ncbi:SAM-dependent methyltransferase [Actinomadura sp. HBU206391]|nr:SAM-dependent methyltransferase [Actinomadura sp. HBU206391]MBC6456690.1 SAM-dependent methyltransferase [Actinomadura sp. HBU206391]
MEHHGIDPSDSSPIRGLDTGRPHSARVWNYWLGGKDCYKADRMLGDKVAALVPGIVDSARADRAFLSRAVRYVGGQEGIRQYLDIGTGLPTMDNTHEVAQRVAPESRVVYVDNDPLVLAHARALLRSTPEGATDYLDADLRDPEKILDAAARTLDFSEPVALMLLAVMHLVTDDEEAYEIVRRLLAALPSGSHLVLAHACIDAEPTRTAVRAYNDSGIPTPIKGRSQSEIAKFFDGLELVEPGVVSCPHWRPEPNPWGTPAEVMTFCGVARKP